MKICISHIFCDGLCEVRTLKISLKRMILSGSIASGSLVSIDILISSEILIWHSFDKFYYVAVFRSTPGLGQQFLFLLTMLDLGILEQKI